MHTHRASNAFYLSSLWKISFFYYFAIKNFPSDIILRAPYIYVHALKRRTKRFLYLYRIWLKKYRLLLARQIPYLIGNTF